MADRPFLSRMQAVEAYNFILKSQHFLLTHRGNVPPMGTKPLILSVAFAIVGLQAVQIALPDDFDQQISQALKYGVLTP